MRRGPQEEPHYQKEQAATADRNDCDNGSDRMTARQCSQKHYDGSYLGSDDRNQAERRYRLSGPARDGAQPGLLLRGDLRKCSNDSNRCWDNKKQERYPNKK
jgi:hypothetical protein